MSEDRPKMTTLLVKHAIAVSGLVCGLLTAWMTLGLLSTGETPLFVHRDTRSVTPAQVVQLKLTAYYPAKRGAAPNPLSESLAENVSGSRGAACDERQWWEVFLRELAKYLGPDVTIQPLGEVSAAGGITRQGCSLDFGDAVGASSPVANENATSAGEKSLSQWPPARYVPLTIPRGLQGAGQQPTSRPGVLLSRSWQIVFPKGTEINKAIHLVMSAVASSRRDCGAAVADRLKSLTEIENQFRQLEEKYPKEIKTFLAPWRNRQFQLIDVARIVLQRSASGQPHPSDPLLAELQAMRANLVKRRQELLMTHTAEHPETKQVESLLAEIEEEIQLRLRRNKEYSVSREPKSDPLPNPETTWLSLGHENPIGGPPLPGGISGGSATTERGSFLAGQRETEGDLLQRLALLRSQLESSEIDLQENFSHMDAEFEALLERFASAREGLHAAILDWEMSNTCVIEPEFDALPTSPQQITQRPTLWALLLALVTGILAHGAVVALLTGVVESYYVSSVKQLSALTRASVFLIDLPQKTTIVEGASPISPPHFATTAAKIGESVDSNV